VLLLVRHGQATLNAEARLAGRIDAPLTDLGRRQAESVGKRLAALAPVGRILTSPLVRARDTAEAIGGAAHADVEIDDRWAEIDYGEFDGLALADVPAEFWARWREDETFGPPGGESLAAVGTRVRQACADLGSSFADEHVVIVSHVSPIKAAVAWTLGVPDATAWRMFLAPASISAVAWGPGGPSLHGFNQTGHLAGLDN